MKIKKNKLLLHTILISLKILCERIKNKDAKDIILYNSLFILFF